MLRQLLRICREAAIGAGIVAAATLVLRSARLNPTTVALVLLVVVLFVAGWRGTMAGVIASVLGTACLNYFFLPPLQTWNIEDPHNWIALGCFLAASILAGRLVTVARREANTAELRRIEIEAMYRLSVDLFQATTHTGRLEEAARRALEAVSAEEGGLVLFDGSFYRQRMVWWRGPHGDLDEDVIAGVGRHRRVVAFPGSPERDIFLPLSISGQSEGVFIVRHTTAALNLLENTATLLALAAERERLFQEQAHIEAIRESERLKTSLLRAVSHDLASPLTALTLHASRLRRLMAAQDGAVVDALDQELSRLRRRIDKLLAFARLEAGVEPPSPEPTPAADLFRLVRESLPTISRTRDVVAKVEEDCPDLFVDPALALEVMINLVENADNASPPGDPLMLRSLTIPGTSSVRLEVWDRGPGMAVVPARNASPGDSDASGHGRRGLGLEIVEGLLRAIGGTLSYLTTDDGWNVARVDLPSSTTATRAERS